jgi:ABC-type nitrate/sulfonate/bicarbonate transport systems, periplasmic components
MMRIPHLLRSILLLGLLALVACSPAPTLRIGSNPWPGYLGLYHARDLGLLDGHPVQLIDFDTTEDVLRAFRNRAIDAAAVTLDEALSLADSGQALRIILVFSLSNGADVVLARPGIDTPQQLRGQRLGVETNALGAYMLARLLEHAGLSGRDLAVIHTPLQEHEAAYRSGRIDAVITFDPQRSRLLAAGAQPIFSSRDIPGEVVDVLVVREDALHRHRATLATLDSAYFQALAQIQRDPAAVAPALGRRDRLDGAALLSAWQLMEFADRARQQVLLGAGPGSLRDTMQRLQQVMQQAGLLSRPVAQDIGLGSTP